MAVRYLMLIMVWIGNEFDERHLDKIYLKLDEMREKEYCTSDPISNPIAV